LQVITHYLSKELSEVEIEFLSDTHIGDAFCKQNQIRKHIESIASRPNVYVICNGDLINNALCQSVSDTYTETTNPQGQLDEVYDLLLPIKDRILVIDEGNHEMRSYKQAGIKPMEQLANMLFSKEGAEMVYTSGAWLLYISLGQNKGRDCRQTVYSIYGKHGAGGGKKVGSKMNRLEDMASVIDADVFVHSHTHVPAIFKNARYRVDYRNRSISEHEQTFINTNAWLGFGGYGEEYGFSPASTSPPKLVLNGNKRKVTTIL